MEEIICPIYENARSAPKQPALISEERVWSYLELDNAIHCLCNFLKESGIREHQRIAFIARNHLSTVILFFALFRLRAIACPLSFRTPQEQISRKPWARGSPPNAPAHSLRPLPITHDQDGKQNCGEQQRPNNLRPLKFHW